jgi:hypothetical protein
VRKKDQTLDLAFIGFIALIASVGVLASGTVEGAPPEPIRTFILLAAAGAGFVITALMVRAAILLRLETQPEVRPRTLAMATVGVGLLLIVAYLAGLSNRG